MSNAGNISFLEWSREAGRDVRKDVPISFDPSEHRTPAAAAVAFRAALAELALAWGQSSKEVMLLTPEASERFGTGRNWRVVWEAGPHEWAIPASFWVLNRKSQWYTEPYYSFDLCFVEA